MNPIMRKLLDCRDIWAWKAITGTHEKNAYYKAFDYPFGCPCCGIAGAILMGESNWINVYVEGRDCDICPLTGIAWNSEWEINEEEEEYEESISTCFCENDPESFYLHFMRSYTTITSQYWAMRMVRACDKAIEKLILESTEDLFQ